MRHAGRREVRLMIGGVGCHTCLNNREAMKHEGPEWWSFRKNPLGRKIGNGETKKKKSWFQRRTRGATGRSVSKIEGAEMFHSVRGALHSAQHMKEGLKKTYHMFWTSIVSGRIYWPNSSKELLIRKGQKIPLHPWLSCVFMDLYVRMWKLRMLIRKLWRFRWNCWINSRWKEARRIQSGESFRSSQVRVKHMSWHPLQICKHTCTKGKWGRKSLLTISDNISKSTRKSREKGKE